MKRYYLSPIVGDGSSPATPFRPKLADLLTALGTSSSYVIPTGADGQPLFAWALCIVNAADHTALLADVDLDSLPDITLDAKLSTLTVAQRNRLLTIAQNHGIDTSGITVNMTFREVLRRIGQHLHASFSENNFDAN